MQRPPSPEAIDAALERALARPELREKGDALARWLQGFIEWLAEVFDFGFGRPAADVGARVLLWLVLAGLVVGLGALLLRLAREHTPARRALPAGGQAQVAARVAELRARARAAEAAGDWLGALRLHFFALVVGLGQRGDLEYRDAWTNRELLLRGEPSAELAATLFPLVRELDERSFGSLVAGPEDVRRFAAVSERMLGGGG